LIAVYTVHRIYRALQIEALYATNQVTGQENEHADGRC